MPQFFETRMGRQYYEATVPNAVREIGRLADNIAALNKTIQTRRDAPVPTPTQESKPATRLRVLLVDDDEYVLKGLERMLKAHCELRLATSVVQALKHLATSEFDVIMTDCDMPGTSGGVALLEEVQASWPDLKRILTSGRDPSDLEEHVKSGLAHRFLPKPVTAEELLATLGVKKP